MDGVEERLRGELVARRARLADLVSTRAESRLVELLRRVDRALAEVDVGEWGRCAVCHEVLSESGLDGDPSVSVCLDCLTADERQSLERDLAAAAQVQRTLLPPSRVTHAGWEIAFDWQPLGAVSGDHVDLVRPAGDEGPLLLQFGDVAGKGVAASLLQSHLHALFRALAVAETPLGDLLSRANRLFHAATAAASYATLALIRLHADGRAELANAGHTRPLLADGRGVRPVEGGGLPLGLFADSEYAGRELFLAPGETLLLYTDGWTEATVEDEEYGIGRAAAALRRASRAAPAEVIAACRRDLDGFLAGAPRGDDLTLLALRRQSQHP